MSALKRRLRMRVRGQQAGTDAKHVRVADGRDDRDERALDQQRAPVGAFPKQRGVAQLDVRVQEPGEHHDQERGQRDPAEAWEQLTNDGLAQLRARTAQASEPDQCDHGDTAQPQRPGEQVNPVDQDRQRPWRGGVRVPGQRQLSERERSDHTAVAGGHHGARDRQRQQHHQARPREARRVGQQERMDRIRGDAARGDLRFHEHDPGGHRGRDQPGVQHQRALPTDNRRGTGIAEPATHPVGQQPRVALAAADQRAEHQSSSEQEQCRVEGGSQQRPQPSQPGQRTRDGGRGAPERRRPDAERERSLELMAVIGRDAVPLHPVGAAWQRLQGSERHLERGREAHAHRDPPSARGLIDRRRAQPPVQRLVETQHQFAWRAAGPRPRRRCRALEVRVSQRRRSAQREQRHTREHSTHDTASQESATGDHQSRRNTTRTDSSGLSSSAAPGTAAARLDDHVAAELPGCCRDVSTCRPVADHELRVEVAIDQRPGLADRLVSDAAHLPVPHRCLHVAAARGVLDRRESQHGQTPPGCPRRSGAVGERPTGPRGTVEGHQYMRAAHPHNATPPRAGPTLLLGDIVLSRCARAPQRRPLPHSDAARHGDGGRARPDDRLGQWPGR